MHSGTRRKDKYSNIKICHTDLPRHRSIEMHMLDVGQCWGRRHIHIDHIRTQEKGNDRFHQVIRKIKVIFTQRWTVMKYQSLVKIQRQNSCKNGSCSIDNKCTILRSCIRNSYMHGTTPKSTIIELPRWGPGGAIDQSRFAPIGMRSTRVESPWADGQRPQTGLLKGTPSFHLGNNHFKPKKTRRQ